MKDPVLFSFRPKSFFEKKTAMIRVEDSNWSDRFSLDVAGSSGLVTCKTEEGDGENLLCYQLGCTIVVLPVCPARRRRHSPYRWTILNPRYYD